MKEQDKAKLAKILKGFEKAGYTITEKTCEYIAQKKQGNKTLEIYFHKSGHLDTNWDAYDSKEVNELFKTYVWN